MKVKARNIIEKSAVIVFILGMGSLYFQIQRMPVMAGLMLAASIAFLLKNRYINSKNFYIFATITAFFILNTVINRRYGFRINDLVIWLVKGFFVVVLASNMTFDRFKRLFVRFMLLEACISLICFLIGDVFNAGTLLPFLHTEQGKNVAYILTPYYTLGWGNIPVFHRNAGMFLEPGMHHIPLNIALYYLLSDQDRKCGFKKSNYTIAVVLFVITILTTRSTTGYICLGVILLAASFRSDYLKGKWRLQLALVVIFAVLVVVEIRTGVVTDKLEGTRYGQGSGLTRYNDTIYGYLLATSRPFTGYGVFSDRLSVLYLQYGIRNISNGMASYCCQAGYPAVIVFLYMMGKGIWKYIDLGWKSNVAFFIFLLLCLNTEGVFMNLFMMAYFFKWKEEKKQNENTIEEKT